MQTLKHCFISVVKHPFIFSGATTAENQAMLEDQQTGNQALALRLKQALDETGVKAADLARACGVTPQAVNGWLRTGRITKKHLRIIAQLLDRRIEWFIQDATPSARELTAEYRVVHDDIPVQFKVPVVGTAQLGDNGHWDELNYPVGNGDGFLLYPSKDGNAYAVRVTGDSMRPRIKHGEFVIVEPSARVEPGHEVLIKTNDGRVMVKTFNFNRNGVVQVSSVNEIHAPMTMPVKDIAVMHRVVGIAQDTLYHPETD